MAKSVEQLLEQKIGVILKEVFKKLRENEDNDDGRDLTKRKVTIRKKLSNPNLNHAPLAEFLYSDVSADTARSLLSKKVRGEDGYDFNPKEVDQIEGYLKSNGL